MKPRKAVDKSKAPGGWVKPQENEFDIMQKNLKISTGERGHSVKFTPSFGANGALTADVAHESTGSGKPSQTSDTPVPEFKNYMRADGRFV